MEKAVRICLSAALLMAGSPAISTLAQSSSQSSSGSKPAATSTTPPNCQWTLPGDGMGPSRLMCSDPSSNSNIPNMRLYTPRTPAGSAYMNALQGYLNAMASRFTPGNEPESPDTASSAPEPIRVGPVVGADLFASFGGKDQNSQHMEDLLRNCPEAVQYVEGKDGLVGEFDKVFAQYKIRKDAVASIQKIKDDLLSDIWWARSSGPDVAREVKFLADGLTDIFGMLSPEGEVVKGIQQLEDVTPSGQLGYDTVGQYGKYVDNIKSAYEGNENVDDATKKAAIDATTGLLKHSKYARTVPFIDFAQHLYERAETEKAGFKFKVEVEYQVRRLDAQITQYENQADNYRQAIEAMNAIHDTVIGVCVPKSIPISNGPKD